MAYLQFLSSRTVVRSCAILFTACFLTGSIFAPECAAWIFFHKPAYEGRVMDAESGEPVEGVAVVAIYRARNVLGGPAGPNSWEIHWKETVTDEKGFFRIPSYTTLVGPNSKEEETRFVFYKPGYGGQGGYPSSWPIEKAVGPDKFFTKEIGKKGETEWGTVEDMSPEGRKRLRPNIVKFTYGVIALKSADTWEERKRSMPSLPFESEEQELPMIYKYMDNEREWLRHNKGWRKNE